LDAAEARVRELEARAEVKPRFATPSTSSKSDYFYLDYVGVSLNRRLQ